MEPKSYVIVTNVITSSIQMVQESLLDIDHHRFLADLTPETLEHTIAELSLIHFLRIEEYNFDSIEFNLHLSEGGIVLRSIISNNWHATIPFKQELPELFIDYLVVRLLVSFILNILINELLLLLVHLVCTKHVKTLFIFLKNFGISHWSWMVLCKMVFRGIDPTLIVPNVKLVVEYEFLVSVQPLGANDVSFCTYRLI